MDVMSANFSSGNLVRNSWMSSAAHIPKRVGLSLLSDRGECQPRHPLECMENPYAHFSGVFFEKMPDLSCDVVVFKAAG